MIIHIGYPKTGTTYLQKYIFSNFKEFNFYTYGDCENLFIPEIYKDDLDYDHRQLKLNLEKIVEANSIFSFEALVGRAFHDNGINKSKVAERLYKLGFNKVIISIRNQINIIDSLYREYVQQGGLDKFDNFVNPKSIRRPIFFMKEYLNYYILIKYYCTIFGKENVLIILQEELKSDENKVLSQLEAFIGAPLDVLISNNKSPNKSISNVSIQLLRIINFFTFSILKPSHLISRHISTGKFRHLFKYVLDPLVFNHLGSKQNFLKKSKHYRELSLYYSNQNQLLETEFNLNLNSFDYPL